jgi:type I restriction enzyme S subunit
MFVTSKDIQTHFITNTEKKLSLAGEKLATIAPANSLLITCYASIGKNALTTERCAFNQSIINLIPSANHVPYFLLLMSEKWSQQMLRISCGSTFKGINKNTFMNLSTYITSFKEQSKLSTFFQLFDDYLINLKKQIELIQQVKKSLLNQMLV